MLVNNGEVIKKKMSKGISEDVESLPIVGIYDINFVYDTNMGVYATLSSDTPKLSEIALTNVYGESKNEI